MKKLLFVTNRNVLTTCGELRLIKNRAEILYNKYNISTDFIVFQKENRINAKDREIINAGGKLDVFGYSMGNPISILTSEKKIHAEIKNRILSGKYGAIVFSGIGMSRYASMVAKYGDTFIIIDIHGSSEDILELAKGVSWKRKLFLKCLYRVDVECFAKNLRYADACFTVTQALEQYIRDRYELKKTVEFYHVPCATLENKVDNGAMLSNRERYRKKYGISDDEVVFIYSGGISTWQCIEETVLLYKDISANIKNKTRMLIFSHNIDAIRKMIDEDESIITDSYSADELRAALNAGDFAFLLRRDCITNNVAFPNKFLEYVQSGMKIIATPYVYDIADQVRNNNIGFLYDMKENKKQLYDYIENIGNIHNSTEVVDSVLLYNSFEQRLTLLAQKFEKM